MSSGLSSLSSSDELDNFNPRTSPTMPPKPLEEELASLALTLPHPHLLSDQEDANGVSDGSEADSYRFGIQQSDEETRVGEVCEENVVGNSASMVQGPTGVLMVLGLYGGGPIRRLRWIDQPVLAAVGMQVKEEAAVPVAAGRRWMELLRMRYRN